MQIDVSKQTGKVPVVVVQPHGFLDASNYNELIEKVRQLMAEGAQDLVIDLGDVPFVSSAGLASIHTIVMMFRGEMAPEAEAGWAAIKSADRSRGLGIQQHVKLLNPQVNVADTFDKAGFTQFLEIYKDLKTAIASF